MIDIKDKVECCGCNACGDVCPKDAITFITDNEGFWYPEINMDKCIDCHLCEKVCPIINIDRLKKNDFNKPQCYAAIHKNYEVRFDSTSGGVFSAFAEKMYRDGGYVGGAVYDENFDVHQFISNDKKDLLALRSSKYTQSSAEGFYVKIRQLLKNGEKVLVCGTPCQMAGLRSFLKTDYENLIIVDFVCRGVNSPKIYHKFERDLEKEVGSKIVWQKAKNKELGWKTMAQKYIFADGSNRYFPSQTNPMAKGYLYTNVFSRPSCYDCRFKGLPRIADISIADCWGIEKINKSMDDNLGTSLVMINSKKGAAFYSSIQQKIKQVDLTFEQAVKANPMIMESQPQPLVDRDEFYKELDKSTFRDISEKYFPIHTDNHRLKTKLKQWVKSYCQIAKYTHYNIYQFGRLLKYNLFKSNIHSDFKKGGILFFSKHTVVRIKSTAEIKLNALFEIGHPKLHHSKLESRFLMEKNSSLEVNSNFWIGYGSDIEIFKGASLVIKSDFGNLKGGGPNMGLTLICGNHIEIGEDCRIGRHVTIRDNNGDHYINLQGYKKSKPVIIGKHVWLCESCTIMQGVKIGDGAIVAAHAVVVTNVPPFSLVTGNPAKVIQHDIHWKF